jgi:putative chitinase
MIVVTPTMFTRMYDCSLTKAIIYAEPLNDAMQMYGVNTAARIAAFLAQVGHESGRLQFVKEIWGPDKCEWQKRYEMNADLGNDQPGDGFKFRGRGLIQITGRYNYTICGQDLGLPLVEKPEILESPKYAAMSAGWFWDKHHLNNKADADDFSGITRVINGGLNGQADRVSLLNGIKQILAG